MSFSETCCTKPPAPSDYVPKGKKETMDDMEVYFVGDSNARATLFGYYDIFGFHNNPFLFSDQLAEKGFRVVLPDFFRGKPWPLDNFPPKNIEDIKKWAFVENSWLNKIKKDTMLVIEHLNKTSNSPKFGVFGFCWGARILFDALMDESPVFQCGAAIHPSGLTENDFKNIKLPVILILSKEETGLLSFESHLNSQHSSCKDYTDQTHGFCASRADFSVKEVQKRATDASNDVGAFFKTNFD